MSGWRPRAQRNTPARPVPPPGGAGIAQAADVMPLVLDPGIVRGGVSQAISDTAAEIVREARQLVPAATRGQGTRDNPYLVDETPAKPPPAAEPPVGDLTSDIAAELAAEEHRQGRIRQPHAGHCDTCDRDTRTRETAHRQRRCPHTETTTIRDIGGRFCRVWCNECGVSHAVAPEVLAAGIDPFDPIHMEGTA